MMKNYEEVLDYLYQQLPMFQRVGKIAYKKDLTNINILCDALGNPESDFPSVHIAGTNGKGSTSHILSAIFQSQGLKVGLYTSPHYIDFRERIKIDGQEIPQQVVIEFVNKYSKKFESVKPSFFEWTVALAFYHFSQENIDIGIIETGLGGRLDSTNIIRPLLSVITNVDLDHMEQLGNTKALIAREKAGIIKEGTPVVLGERDEEYYDVILETATAKNSKLILASDVCSVRENKEGLSKSEYAITINGDKFRQVSDLSGGYQAFNIRTALAAYLQLSQLDEKYRFETEKVVQSFSSVRPLTNMLGRWQLVSDAPPTILDGAHNLQALQFVLERYRSIDAERRHIVIGFSDDKDLSKVFNLLPRYAVYYFCKADVPRGASSSKLVLAATQSDLKGQAYPSVKSAFEAARKNATEFDSILVSGSIFIVGEVLAFLNR